MKTSIGKEMKLDVENAYYIMDVKEENGWSFSLIVINSFAVNFFFSKVLNVHFFLHFHIYSRDDHVILLI